ncbi:hypothetical protein CPLU01_00631 [Colletotrichum plurivorum]|uniref:Uncharacterized protein n=1 Tax=Colletotrichum plurivorum TaxID=2175906 RepID=A0A8H6U6A0_9PEZI|nr:hypothetical protein CPLU01_00631 [Colletotrichum plurivorum]
MSEMGYAEHGELRLWVAGFLEIVSSVHLKSKPHYALFEGGLWRRIPGADGEVQSRVEGHLIQIPEMMTAPITAQNSARLRHLTDPTLEEQQGYIKDTVLGRL